MALNWKTKVSLVAVAAAAFVAGAVVTGSLNVVPVGRAETTASPDLDALRRIGVGFSQVVQEISPAVVNVRVSKRVTMPHPPFGGTPFDKFFGNPFDEFFQMPKGEGQDFLEQGSGSGVIVSRDGYILTNNHVVEGADNITVRTADGKEYPAKVIGTDPKTDIAVIKVDADGLKPAKLGDSDKVVVGEWVLAIGNPFELSNTVTAGIISARGRSNVGLAEYEDFIQTDAAINPGNSGGPLVNLNGEVIGINTAIATRTGGYMGIGFAIPINMAKDIMDQLIKTGKVVRGWLGVYIQPITPDLKEQFDLKTDEGALIADVTKGSPAERAGLQRGDVIVKFQGERMKDPNQLRKAVAATPVGTVADVTVIRNGVERNFKVKIGELPAETARAERQPGGTGDWGFEVTELTPRARQQLGLEEGQEGVLVTDVKQASDAYQKGLREGDVIIEVNRVAVRNVREFNDAMSRVRPGDKVLLLVITEGHTRYVSFTVGK